MSIKILEQYQKPVYNIPSTLTFFDAKVERDVGFIYGLQVENDTVDIIKLAACQYTEHGNPFLFFDFKDINGKSVDPFTENYPSYKTDKQIELFYITSEFDSRELFYDISGRWTSEIRACGFFGTKHSAEIYLENHPISVSYEIKSMFVSIKQLVKENIAFPIPSGAGFILDDPRSYSITQLENSMSDPIHIGTLNVQVNNFKINNLYETNYNFEMNILNTVSLGDNISTLKFDTIYNLNPYSTTEARQADETKIINTLSSMLSTNLSAIFK